MRQLVPNHFLFGPQGMWVLQPGIESVPPCSGSSGLNHWISREVLVASHFALKVVKAMLLQKEYGLSSYCFMQLA